MVEKLNLALRRMYDTHKLKFDIAMVYQQKDYRLAAEMCRNFINREQGKVDDVFFRLLFDLYQICNNEEKFLKLATVYSDVTGNVAPQWRIRPSGKAFAQQNALLINGGINRRYEDEIKRFQQHCEKTGFGRIDMNRIRLLESNAKTFRVFLDLFAEIQRHDDWEIVLMGENGILDFDLSLFTVLKEKVNNGIMLYEHVFHYPVDVDDNHDDELVMEYKSMNGQPAFGKANLIRIESDEMKQKVCNEADEVVKLCYLLKMAICQWRGHEQSYIELAYEYMQRYSEIPQTYLPEHERPVSHQTDNRFFAQYSEEYSDVVLHIRTRELAGQYDLKSLQSYIFDGRKTVYLDMSEVDYFEDKIAEKLCFALNQMENAPLLFVVGANTLIQTVFEMTGLSVHASFDVVSKN